MHRRNILLFAVLFYSPRRFDIDRHAILQRCEKKKKKRKKEEKKSRRPRSKYVTPRDFYIREKLYLAAGNAIDTRSVARISSVSVSLSSSSFFFVFYFLFPFFVVRYDDFTRSCVYRNDARITLLGNLEKADETRVSNTSYYSFCVIATRVKIASIARFCPVLSRKYRPVIRVFLVRTYYTYVSYT